MGKDEALDFYKKEIKKLIDGIDDAIYLRRIFVIISTHLEGLGKT